MTKITDQELKSIRDIQDKNQRLTIQLGQLHSDAVIINAKVKEIEQQLIQAYNDSNKISSEIVEKYGPGVLNIETGEITEK